MSEFEKLSTEELLHDNPVRLKRLPPNNERLGNYRFAAYLKTTGEHIGGTQIAYWNTGPKSLYRPEIGGDFRGRGLGLAMYICASELADDLEYNPILGAQEDPFLSLNARHVWESLVRRGIAEGGPDAHNRYRFKVHQGITTVPDC